MWNKFPRLHEVDRDRFARDMARPLPDKQYVMYFTPRSGSSWITDIAGKTRHLSIPGEIFNPNFMAQMAQKLNVTRMDEYCEVLKRRRATAGVFGFQITHHQLAAVFRDEADFLARFPSPVCFWLIRRDIVLQAVSLYKMQATKISHAPQTSPDAILRAEVDFSYDGAAIKHWLLHILGAELATEAMFARFGLKPLRMSYERNAEMKPNHIVNVMGRHIGLPGMKLKPLQSAHSKIATPANDLYAARFRAENAGFLAGIDAQRAVTLDQLEYYGPRRTARIRPDAPPETRPETSPEA